MSDPDKRAVYACERRLEQVLGQRVHVGGRFIDVESDHEFTTLAAAALDATLTCMELGLPPVRVRHRRGDAMSHYYGGEIALASWGGTKFTLYHELAHHLVATRHRMGGHGPHFRAALLDLLPPGQAEYLRHAFESARLAVPIPV